MKDVQRESTKSAPASPVARLPVRVNPRRHTRKERQPERAFVDVQARGPYSHWHHTHEFEAAYGGTAMRDGVRYRLPFGALGELVASRLVRRDLEAIFDFPRERIRELLA